jgi:hypothetical protein
MDCSQPSSLPSYCYGRGGKYSDDELSVKIPRNKRGAIDAAIAVGLKLRKTLAGKELFAAATDWLTKSGFAKSGTVWGATLVEIVCRVYINTETENPVW